MKLSDLLQGIGSPVAFYPDLVPIAGSQNAAIFLCQLTYWHGKQRNPNGWMYKTQEEWFLETSLTDKQQKNARELLVERGFIEERYRGIPRRLEYRLKEDGFNEIWDIWMIAINLKKDLKALLDEHGVNSSRGIPIEEMQAQIKVLRAGMEEAYTTIDTFFEQCREERKNPFDLLHKLKSSLSKIAETIQKSIIAHIDGLVKRFKTRWTQPKRDTVNSLTDELLDSYGRFAEASNQDAVSRPDPSENTAKTTTKTSSKSEHGGAENTHNWANPLKIDLPEKEQKPINAVEVEVISEPSQSNEDQGTGSQGKTDPLIKTNIPGRENHSQKCATEARSVGDNTITPCVVIENDPQNLSWVARLEEIIRNGDPLPRLELFKLADYRLGEYVALYRASGRVMDADPNDLNLEFLRFVQWYSFKGDPDIEYVRLTVKKCERNPEQWDVLLGWLKAFQEVQTNPEHLETILKGKVASQGRNPNTQDLGAINSISFEKSMSASSWEELVKC